VSNLPEKVSSSMDTPGPSKKCNSLHQNELAVAWFWNNQCLYQCFSGENAEVPMLMILAALLGPAGQPGTPVRPTSAAAPDQAAIQLTLNHKDGEYTAGEGVGIRVTTRDDGYILVLRVNDDRQIQVLFPLDPNDDAFVRGGKEYEIRSRDQGEAFAADEVPGTGLIYAAVYSRPFDLGHFVVNGHWDYGTLQLNDTSADPEGDLTQLISVMTNQQRFDYDAVGYTVQQIAAADYASAPEGYYPGYYDPYYNPAWRCIGCGWGYPSAAFNINVGLGFGYYNPYYDPFLFDPWIYTPSYWGYGYYGSLWYPGLFPPVIVNSHPVRPRLDVPGYGTRARPRAIATPQGTGRIVVPNNGRGVRNPSAPPSPVGRPDAGRARPRAPAPSGRPSASAPQPSSRPASPGRSSGVRARPGGGHIDVGRPIMVPGASIPGRSVSAGRVEARPVFREPPRANPGAASMPSMRNQPRPASRPVYREPPRVETRPVARPSTPAARPSMPAPRPSARPSPPPPHAAPAPTSHGGGGAPRARAPAPRPGGGGHGRSHP
jgi:Domain of unknown function (DUF4384)